MPKERTRYEEWHRRKDSHLEQRFWRPSCYCYTTPIYKGSSGRERRKGGYTPLPVHTHTREPALPLLYHLQVRYTVLFVPFMPCAAQGFYLPLCASLYRDRYLILPLCETGLAGASEGHCEGLNGLSCSEKGDIVIFLGRGGNPARLWRFVIPRGHGPGLLPVLA